MGPSAVILPCGERMHLQHGPIDLIIGADGDRQTAFAAARDRFDTVLDELVCELSELRLPLNSEVPVPTGEIALCMDAAARPFTANTYVTRMAAVAGSVADAILEAMTSASLTRAFVNNGGDIALHLTKGASFNMAIAGHGGNELGRLRVGYDDPFRGIATSGRHGRSLSLGIADSVTVLAANAARADVAATLIANAVDLPEHEAITRKPANRVDETSDLGDIHVVVCCGQLTQSEKRSALASGRAVADTFIKRHLISDAALFLQGQANISPSKQITSAQRTPINA